MTINAVLYRPRHQRQLVASDPHGRYNCSAYALAMAIDAVTIGGLVVPGTLVRWLSDEPVPNPRSPGLNLPQLVDVATELRVPFQDRTGHTFAELLDDLPDLADWKDGHRVVLQFDRDPDGCSRFDRGHAMLISARRRGEVLANDPLCGAPRWYDADRLHEAARRFARRSGVDAGIRFIRSARVVPPIARSS